MTVYDEDEWLMLSCIQHFVFCRRQRLLLYIGQIWQDNVLTLEGQQIHERADNTMIREKRGELLIIRALPLHSFRSLSCLFPITAVGETICWIWKFTCGIIVNNSASCESSGIIHKIFQSLSFGESGLK